MLIVAVSSKTEGEMLRVRPVREKDSFRTRSPTTQSEPPSRHNIEKETRRVVCGNAPVGGEEVNLQDGGTGERS